MIVPALALAATFLTAAPVPADAPTAQKVGIRIPLPGVGRGEVLPVVQYTLADAPTSPLVSFTASALTSTTGLLVLGLAAFSPPNDGLPWSGFSFHARLATSLLLLSAGPSVGDLMNDDLRGFLIGALGRSAIAAGGYGLAVLAVENGQNAGVVVLSALGMMLGGMLWSGWGLVDLVRSYFAPQRWVERQNRAIAAASVPSRAPVPEVRQTGGMRLASF